MADRSLVRQFNSLPVADRRLAFEALVALALSSLAVRFLPFRRAVAFGAVPLGVARATVASSRVRWAIEGLGARLPWRTVCFQQGLAMQRLLRRRGIDAQLHYGMLQDPATGPKAHVWVTVDDEAVIGGEEALHYARLASFPAPVR